MVAVIKNTVVVDDLLRVNVPPAVRGFGYAPSMFAAARQVVDAAYRNGFKTDAEAKEQAEEALKNLAELLGGFGDKLKKILEEKDEK